MARWRSITRVRPVAQGIERLPPEQKAAGSNPAGGTGICAVQRPFLTLAGTGDDSLVILCSAGRFAGPRRATLLPAGVSRGTPCHLASAAGLNFDPMTLILSLSAPNAICMSVDCLEPSGAALLRPRIQIAISHPNPLRQFAFPAQTCAKSVDAGRVSPRGGEVKSREGGG